MRNDGDGAAHDAVSPPPSLNTIGDGDLPTSEKSTGNEDEKPPVIQPIEEEEQIKEHPVLKAHLEEEKNSVYTIMYSHSQHSDISFNRPITPLQITIPDGNASPTVPVSCGVVTGRMHLHMFLCPGIHQPCIELGSELLSPKQFTVRGDKEKQKDWKASIRVGKSSLRTHMEAATIDFYDHENRCSGKCQSRNYVNAPTEREEVIQSRKMKRNADADYLKNEIEHEISGKDIEEKKTNPKKARGRPRGSVNKPRLIKTEMVPDDTYFDDFYADDQPPHVSAVASEISIHAPEPTDRNLIGCSSYSDVMQCLQNDPQNFWSQMQQTGVICHFLDDLIFNVINLKQSVMEIPINPTLASTLTRTTFALNVQNSVVHRVQAIERSVHQQRKHEEMFHEIQSEVAEEQRQSAGKQEQDGEIEIVASSNDIRSFEELRTAREIIESEDFIDVVKYEEYPHNGHSYIPQEHQQPGPSNIH